MAAPLSRRASLLSLSHLRRLCLIPAACTASASSAALASSPGEPAATSWASQSHHHLSSPLPLPLQLRCFASATISTSASAPASASASTSASASASTSSSEAAGAQLPELSDPGALKALRSMLACPWHPLSNSVVRDAEAVLAKSSEAAAREAVGKARAAAEAVEAFGEKLELLRLDLDELSGGKFGGEAVGELPEYVKAALLSALKRYTTYLGMFEADEEWLRKKVEEELGTQLLLLKQRCSGMEAEWNKVTLLGTSGLSGSYIEKRA